MYQSNHLISTNRAFIYININKTEWLETDTNYKHVTGLEINGYIGLLKLIEITYGSV